MAKIHKIEIELIEALAIAIAAFRASNNTVRQYTADPTAAIDTKSMVYNCFVCNKKFPGCDAPDLKDAAEEVRNSIRGFLTMSMLMTVKIPDFQKNICDLLEKDKISTTNFGLLIWAPKVHADVMKANKVREDTMLSGACSRFQGKIKEKITINFVPISVRYLTMYNCWAHTGHDENGNLFSFLNKTEFKAGKITARVKEHKQDARNCNYNVTALNFVKVAK